MIYIKEQIRKRFIELKLTGQRFALSAEEKREKDLQLIHYLKSVVGINSAINAFIYNGELRTAKEIYTNARKIGLPKNHYIETGLK